MKVFHCQCGAPLFFDNSVCLTCGRELGFLPDALEMVALERAESDAGSGSADYLTPYGSYRKCQHYVNEGVCNWMLPSSSEAELCQACELNNVIPDLSKPENNALWLEVEKAKRRLIYSLNRLHLPVVSKSKDPVAGLSFDIKADEGNNRVLTGHNDGLITLNLGEADAAAREKIRLAMKERYRTLLGHFRHEIGHYYWDVLVRDTPALGPCRALFGDDQLDYAEALKHHYSTPPAPNYASTFISHYAASHAWEDFAETFAHYLHMVDTLETAEQFGFAGKHLDEASRDFEGLMEEWYKLTVALNSLNRSMGLPDAYPFAIAPAVKEKLGFVHRLIQDAQLGSIETNTVVPRVPRQEAAASPRANDDAPRPRDDGPRDDAPRDDAPRDDAPRDDAPLNAARPAEASPA
jgi:hypothetical protein